MNKTSTRPAVSILKPGRNCWRIEHADRVCFLIDGDSYFRAFRSVVASAQRSVFILAWDIDSRLRLLRDDRTHQAPLRLSEFLQWLLKRRRRLHVYLLSWDFAILWSANREWLPIYKLGGKTHRRMHVHLDDRHPVGACHHQKVVVVDGQIAFAGGLDLALGRWDTPQHLPDDPRRIEYSFRSLRPYHDVQMMVSGGAAAALAELASIRWRYATGHAPRRTAIATPASDPWPDGFSPDLENVPVAIVRTQPACDGLPEIREVEQLYLDSIAAARKSIYIENQYLTADRVGAALARCLAQRDGPEVILVLGFNTEGWLGQKIMDMLRVKLIRKLREADRHDRLRVYYPDIPGAGNHYLNVHSKVMIVDERLLRIGSSNLDNRSMGFDTECDLVIEAAGEARIEQAIAHFRDRLLGEHLDVSVEKVAQARAASGSLIAAIETLSGPGRSLKPLEPVLPAVSEAFLDEVRLADPEAPIDPDYLVGRFMPEARYSMAGRRIFRWLLSVTGLLLLVLAWSWTPLHNWLNLSPLAVVISRLQQFPATPLLITTAFVTAGLLAVPLTLLIIVTVLLYGLWVGFIYSLAGVMASAMCGYAAGRLLGRKTLRRLAGSRFSRIIQGLGRRSVLTIIMVRIIPVAPFTLINLGAGVSRTRLRDFLLGTLLGMAPGMLAVALLVDLARASVLSPRADTIILFVAVASFIGVTVYFLGKWLTIRARQAEEDAGNKTESS